MINFVYLQCEEEPEKEVKGHEVEEEKVVAPVSTEVKETAVTDSGKRENSNKRALTIVLFW